jgi:branched-subunit amino acid ABC-type transport system permease component
VQLLDYLFLLDQLLNYYGLQILENVDKPLLEGRIELGSVFIGQPQTLCKSLFGLLAFIGLYLFVTKTETGLALQSNCSRQTCSGSFRYSIK